MAATEGKTVATFPARNTTGAVGDCEDDAAFSYEDRRMKKVKLRLPSILNVLTPIGPRRPFNFL